MICNYVVGVAETSNTSARANSKHEQCRSIIVETSVTSGVKAYLSCNIIDSDMQ